MDDEPLASFVRDYQPERHRNQFEIQDSNRPFRDELIAYVVKNLDSASEELLDALLLEETKACRIHGINYLAYCSLLEALIQKNAVSGFMILTEVAKMRNFDMEGTLRGSLHISEERHTELAQLCNVFIKTPSGDNDGPGLFRNGVHHIVLDDILLEIAGRQQRQRAELKQSKKADDPLDD